MSARIYKSRLLELLPKFSLMWVIPGMTTAPTPSLIESVSCTPPMYPDTNTRHRLLSPSHFVSFPAKQQVLCDWQYRNPLGALFPLNNFTSNMSSPFRAVSIAVNCLLSLP